MHKLKTKSKKIVSLVPQEERSYSFNRQGRYQDERYLNNYQQSLYHRALYGLNTFSEKVLATMHPAKKHKIYKNYIYTKDVLNIWKQEIIVDKTNGFMKAFFPKSSFVTDLIENYSEPDLKFKCNVSLESLGVTKEQIIDKLIEKKILPENFFELKED